MAKENKIPTVKMKAWRWLDPTGIAGRESHYVNDEPEMMNATFSDGAHGQGGIPNDFAAPGVLGNLGAFITFSADCNRLLFFFP